MDEYVFEDLIMNPETPNLERLIGKEVYFSNVPLCCIQWANTNCEVGILKEIDKDDGFPFRVETPHEDIRGFVCIIPKKEELKPEYIPFQDGREFFNSYLSVESRLEKEDYFLSNHGIWLKDKTSKAYYMVTKIWDIGDDSDEISWKELLEYYTFLDGSPCGKEVEDE